MDDNRGTVAGLQAGRLTGQDANAILEKLFANKTETLEFQVTMQPGDNFRIAGNGDRDFVANLINHDATLHDLQAANDNERNANKQKIAFRVTTPQTTDIPILDQDKYVSKTLTVWRFLHVERDSMGPPPAGEPFNQPPGMAGEDDVDPGNLDSPPIDLMVTNYRPAYIEVLDDLATGFGALDTRDDIPFVHNLTLAGAGQASLRDVPSLNRFWVVNVVSSYEGPVANDNDDPQPEAHIVLGFTALPVGSDGPCHIFYETIRDLRAYLAAQGQPVPVPEATLVLRTVLHESGHRFNMVHSIPPDPVNNPGDQGPLRTVPNNVFGTDADNQFTPAQLDVIRSVSRPM